MVLLDGTWKKGEEMARPKLKVTPQMLAAVTQIAVTQCPDEEIAAFLGISYSTFKRRKAEDPELSEAVELGRDNGKQTLRQVQWNSAVEDKNITMMIWLGKQYLGQSDKTDLLGRDGKPFEFTIAINSQNGDQERDEETIQDPGQPLVH